MPVSPAAHVVAENKLDVPGEESEGLLAGTSSSIRSVVAVGKFEKAHGKLLGSFKSAYQCLNQDSKLSR